MAERYFPFAEVTEGDRQVTAAQEATFLGSIRTRGVIKGFNNALAVTESSPQALSVDIDTGAAFVGLNQMRAYENTAIKTLTIDTADGSNPRDDLVVLRMDMDSGVRTLVLAVVTGTPAGSPSDPSLTQTEALYELPIYRVRVGTSVSVITNANLTDLRGTGDSAAVSFSEPNNVPGSVTIIHKASTETIDTSTTLQDDDDFTFAVVANSTYKVLLHLILNSGTTPDWKFQWSLPASATIDGRVIQNLGVGSTVPFDESASVQTINLAADEICIMEGTIRTAGTAGIAVLQWAQFASDAGNTSVVVRSFMTHQLMS